MEKIVFAGSFDPLTNGHLYVIKEGLDMAEKVLVFVAQHHAKKTMFSPIERKEMIEQVCKDEGLSKRVEVHIIHDEYVAKKALRMGAKHLIRGIRGAMEFDYEHLIQKTNTDVLHGAKTVFVMPPGNLDSVSSSYVKSLVGPIGWHWQIKKFLPQAVYQKWINNFVSSTARDFIKSPQVEELIMDVLSAYNGQDRHYHNLDHIAHCLQEMIWLKNHESSPAIDFEQLCVAILTHDIVYGAKQKQTDEQLSVQYVLDKLGSNYQLAHELVLSTQHLAEIQKEYTEQEKIMQSLDLAILGQDGYVYEEYAQNVRREYSWVEEDLYKKGRTQALQTLLAHQVLYTSEYFAHYEEQARENLQQELQQLNQ